MFRTEGVIKGRMIACTFLVVIPVPSIREESNLTQNGCPIKVLGHDGESEGICEFYYETVNK
jgi:hypothetical protein